MKKINEKNICSLNTPVRNIGASFWVYLENESCFFKRISNYHGNLVHNDISPCLHLINYYMQYGGSKMAVENN